MEEEGYKGESGVQGGRKKVIREKAVCKEGGRRL